MHDIVVVVTCPLKDTNRFGTDFGSPFGTDFGSILGVKSVWKASWIAFDVIYTDSRILNNCHSVLKDFSSSTGFKIE